MAAAKKSSRAHQAQQAKAEAVFAELLGEVKELNPVQVEGNERWEDIDVLDDNPYQPRQFIHPGRLRRMVDSLNENGQQQTVLARPHPTRKGRYQLASGHRRKSAIKAGGNAGSYLPDAHQYIGKMRISVANLSDAAMLDAAYAENADREDFNVFDIAHYYLSLQQLNATQPGKLPTWEELVDARKAQGKPLPLQARGIRRVVEVLDLPGEIQKKLLELDLSEDETRFIPANEKHCRALLSLQPAFQKDSKEPANAAQRELLKQIEDERLSGNEALRRASVMRAALEQEEDGEETAEEVASGWVSSGRASGVSSSSTTATVSAGHSGGSTGVGMPSGQSNAVVSAQTSLGDEEPSFNDIAAVLLEPAARNLADAVRLLPSLTMTEDYRARVKKALKQVEQEAARVAKLIK